MTLDFILYLLVIQVSMELHIESGVSYQDHVTSGDVHVGGHGLLAPGGGAAAGGGAGRRAVAELGRDAVEPRVAQGLRALHALRRAARHALSAQLLGRTGERAEVLLCM